METDACYDEDVHLLFSSDYVMGAFALSNGLMFSIKFIHEELLEYRTHQLIE